MSIILVNPPNIRLQAGLPMPYVTREKHNLTASQRYTLPMENLGLMYIASYAESRGIPVHVIDALLEEHTGPEQTFASIKRLSEQSGTPELIGFTTIVDFNSLLDLVSRCKTIWPNVLTCLGGPFATLNYERVLQEWSFDYVCIGDGEIPFALLAEAVFNNRSLDAVPGLATRNSQGKIKITSPPKTDIDSLPWPSRQQLPLVLAEGFSASVSTQRGCPYRCSYCVTGAISASIGKEGHNLRSVESVVEEICYLHREFQIPFVTIVDDLFVSKAPSSQIRAEEFARLLFNKSLPIQFMCDVRVDSINKDLFLQLHQAGLRRVFIGVETGSEDQLHFYRKRHSKSHHETVERLALLESIGIEVIAGTIVWHPTVTPNEIRATIAILDNLNYKAASRLRSRLKIYSGAPVNKSYDSSIVYSDWPTINWRFADHRAQVAFDTVFKVAEAPETTYEQARSTLLNALKVWEKSPEA
jgi:radical SAM superfamily enzyme YgiQ (UPF0313 family)